MNKQAYRVIFNRARGMLMVVAENASRQGKGAAGDSDARISALPLMRFAPLGLMVAALFGHVTVVQAQMVAYKNGGPRPTIDQSANGRPLVQIVTPNAAGVSHNRYDQYNVDSNGVILNNTRTATQTQLGGYIDGNPNLAGGSARIVLNEVMGSGRSQLNGYTEVAGQRAEVIIANPNGITCSGCGFINTSRGVLTTGTPVFGGDGSLGALRVTRGDIQINGMNAGNTDQTDLIARSVQVNGQLWANSLHVVTGANQVNYGDLGVQVIQGEGVVPSVGIDVAALGGMYAGKIMLKGTEQGVGVVSAGNIAASAGDVTIDSAGLVKLSGATNASGNIVLRSDADVSNDGTLYARQAIHIGNAGQMRNSGTIAAGADVNLRAGSIDSSGTLGAGIDANGLASQPGSLALVADGAVAAVGQNTATGHIGIQGASLNLAGARTTAGGNVDLTATAGDIDHAGASLLAGDGSNVSAAGALNNRQGEINANQLNIHAANLDNRQGRLIQTGAAGGSVDVADTLDNRNGGMLQTNGDDLTLTPQTLLNDSGTIAHAGKGMLTIGSGAIGSLSNQGGSIGGNGQLKVAMAAVNNQSGKLFAARQAEIRSGNLNNSGGYVGAASLHLASATINNQGGTVESSAGDLTVSGTDLVNDGGTLQSLGGNLALDNNGNLSNRSGGFIGSSAALTLRAGSIDNAGGAIYGAGGVSLASAGEFNNDGGAIQSDADASLQAGGALSNQGGRIETNGSTASLSLAAGTLDNSAGRIANAGTGTTSMRSAHISNAGGVLGGNGDVTLTANALDNSRQGQVIASGNLALHISNMLNNSAGKLYAGRSLAFDQAGAVIDNSNGSISADGNIVLHSASLDNSSGSIVTGSGNIDLQQSGVIANHAGQIAAATDLDLAAGTLTGDGTVIAGHDAELSLQGDYIHSAANRITANRNLQLNATGALTNNGTLQAADGLTLTAGNIINAQSALINSGATVLLAQQNLLNQGRIYGDGIALSAATLTNDADAVIASRNTLHIGAATIVNREHALLASLGDMAIGGALDANQQATGQAATITNSSATIDAGGNLSLHSASLLNQNAHFSTEEQIDPTKTVRVTEYRSWNSDTWYRADQVSWSDSGDGGIVLVLPDGSRFEKFYKRDYTLTVSQTVVKNSDPGKISVGGNLLLSGNVANDKSTIIAGGTISGQTGHIANIGATGTVNPVQYMTAGENYYHWVSGSSHDNHYTYDNNGQAYDVALPATDIALPVWSLQENTNPGHGDNPATGQQVGPSQLPGATGGSLGSNQGGPGMSGTQQSVAGPDGQLPNLQLPTSQLYQLHPLPGQPYLIVTDPAFTSYQQFLSSDYLLGRLGIDPQAVHKRLGDGYYEQQLITNQVAQLTGRRYLDGYNSNEDAYRALMDAGVATAQQFQLTPGVALNDAQMAALTSDIVWLVTQTVTLPDGSSTEVLAPVLYLARTNAGDVRADGALIAGQNIDLSINGSLANGGTLQAGSNLIVNASGDISNSGRLQSTAKDGTVILAAQNDVRSSGSISGNRVGILAGRDIDLASTTSSATSKNGTNIGLNQIASVNADQLSMLAGRDMNLAAADINTTADASLTAGRDLSLTTVKTQNGYNVTYNADNHLYENRTQVNGTQIQSGGNLTLAAGQDINAAAAYANAGGQLTAVAGRDVHIGTAEQTSSVDQAIYTTSKGMMSSSSSRSQRNDNVTQAIGSSFTGNGIAIQSGRDTTVQGSQVIAQGDMSLNAGRDLNIVSAQQTSQNSFSVEEKKSGFSGSVMTGVSYGKSTQDMRQNGKSVSQIGSDISGANVRTNSGRDTTITASTITADKDVVIYAGRDINVLAAANTQSVQNDSHSSGTSIGIMGGLNGRFTNFSQTSATQSGSGNSMVQSTSLISANGGNLSMQAGLDSQYKGTGQGNVTTQGAELLARDRLSIGGNAVDLQAIQDSSANQFHANSRSVTLGSSLTGTVGGAVTGIGDRMTASQNTSNDRLQGALALKAGYDTYKLAGALPGAVVAAKDSISATQNALAGPNSDAPPGTGGAGFGISVNLGASQSRQDSQNSASQARGTTAQAGSIDITAREGDINMEGAKLQARDISLDAARNINLIAAKNTADLQSSNSGSSAGIGATLGSNGQQTGLSFQVGASVAKGHANGSETTYDNTQISASNQLSVKSGGDLNMMGAQLAGNQVTADIGGNLNVWTLQDKSNFDGKQESGGFSLSICVPPICTGQMVSGSVSYTNQTVDHNYQSAVGQSGIAAGSGGFDIKVKGNTDLVGAAITSTADKDKNNLQTASLTSSDLANSQHTSSSSVSAGASTGSIVSNITGNALGNLNSGLGMPENGDQSSSTSSVISPAKIVITGTGDKEKDAQSQATADTLTSRDAATANEALANTLTLQQAQDLQARQQQAQENQQAAGLVGSVLTNIVGDVAKNNNWPDGSLEKIALHGMVGVIEAKIGGSSTAGGLAAGMGYEAMVPAMSEYLVSQGYQPGTQAFNDMMNLGATLVGAASGMLAGGSVQSAAAGANIGLVADRNNRQLHPSEKELAKTLAQNSNGKYTVEQVEDQMRGMSMTTNGKTEAGKPDVIIGTNLGDGKWIMAGTTAYGTILATSPNPVAAAGAATQFAIASSATVVGLGAGALEQLLRPNLGQVWVGGGVDLFTGSLGNKFPLLSPAFTEFGEVIKNTTPANNLQNTMNNTGKK
ncbi:hemagglutinin repeat-containing protein [Collimonas humicola]|uniref:hemagglutinin repeat-containing protein n=1 Tax=Collimonas humicola TaxID=2825886 RepID=UPI001B8B0FCA|nr:hemagglutinin repeat-containing protein [Collimonas humicola]